MEVVFLEDIKNYDINVYDLDGNKTTFKDSLGEKEVYISYNTFKDLRYTAYNSYFNKANEILNNSYYDSEAYTYFEDADNRNEFNTTLERVSNNYFSENYPEGFNKENDFNYIKNLIDKYYTKIQSRIYTISVANMYSEKYQEKHL